jgi:hypothetical protein
MVDDGVRRAELLEGVGVDGWRNFGGWILGVSTEVLALYCTGGTRATDENDEDEE